MSTQIPPQAEHLNEQLYDILMGPIEPDLTTGMLPILDELYLGETEEEYEERMKRYAGAIVQFQDRAELFVEDCKNAMLKLKDHAMALAKDEQKKKDDSDVSSLEQSLQDS